MSSSNVQAYFEARAARSAADSRSAVCGFTAYDAKDSDWNFRPIDPCDYPRAPERPYRADR